MSEPSVDNRCVKDRISRALLPPVAELMHLPLNVPRIGWSVLAAANADAQGPVAASEPLPTSDKAVKSSYLKLPGTMSLSRPLLSKQVGSIQP